MIKAVRYLGQTLTTTAGLRAMAEQFASTALSGSALIIVAGFTTGIVLTMQFGQGMKDFGATSMIPALVAITIVRGTGPLLSALLFAGQTGGAVAAELAAMVSTQQVDALRSIGVDPFERIIAPRIIAVVVGTVLLTMASIAAGLIGCLCMSLMGAETSTIWFYTQIQNALSPADILLAICKAVTFGLLIAAIACAKGMSAANKTAKSTSIAATTAVVQSSFAIIFADVVLTKLSLWLLF